MQLWAAHFLEFQLPNSASWFYLSLVLVIGLFFRFDRSFHLRNLDLVALFLLVPALLYLRDGQQRKPPAQEALVRAEAAACAAGFSAALETGVFGVSGPVERLVAAEMQRRDAQREYLHAEKSIWQAYLFLLLGSGYFMVRCLLDLGLARRPTFHANLNPGGLIWIGATILVVLAIKAVMPAWEPPPDASRQNLLLEQTARVVTEKAAEQMPGAVVAESGIDVYSLARGGLAITCHLAIVSALFYVGVRHFQNAAAGIGASVLYLLLPYTAYYVGHVLHIVPAAILAGAIAWYRRPAVAGVLLGIGAAAVYFPVVLFPLWFGFYRRRGAVRFAAAFALSVAALGLYRWFDAALAGSLGSAMSLPDWRAFDLYARPSVEGLWTGLELHYAYRVPLFVAYVALVLATAFWPSPKSLAHLIALSAALVIGVQFWYADAGGIYVLWYLPLFILVCIRPGLEDRYAPEIDPASDWLHRAGRWLRARLTRPTPTVPAGEPLAAVSGQRSGSSL